MQLTLVEYFAHSLKSTTRLIGNQNKIIPT